MTIGLSLLKGASKLAVGVGAVYVTLDQGVWSTETTQSSKVLDTVRTKVLPAANEYFEKVPSSEELSNKVVNGWNKGVQVTFSGLAKAPDTAVDLSKTALNQVKQNLRP